jgi:hypothetical protein
MGTLLLTRTEGAGAGFPHDAAPVPQEELLQFPAPIATIRLDFHPAMFVKSPWLWRARTPLGIVRFPAVHKVHRATPRDQLGRRRRSLSVSPVEP